MAPRQHGLGRRAQPGLARLAALLLVTLALLLHLLAVQTHVHPLGGGHRDAPQLSAPTGNHVPAPADCPSCRQLARGGTALPVLPLPLEAPGAGAGWFVVAAATIAIGYVRSHAWRSRGPPPRAVTRPH